MYQVRLLSIDRQLIAIIQSSSISFSKKISEATEVSIAIPRKLIEKELPGGEDIYAFLSPSQPALAQRKNIVSTPNVSAEARIARLVSIYKNGKHVVTGRIADRDIQDEVVTISCLTEEILLEGATTPAQYGAVYDNWDLADVARSLCFAQQVIRVKDKAQWQQRLVANYNCDIRDDNYVMLAKANGRYNSSGYIVIRFNKSEFPGFTKWDRIRWLSDHEEPVYSTMQYRHGPNTSSLSSWSQEHVGSSPETIGIVPATVDAEIIEVRINLRTDDTESEDPNGIRTGQSPVLFAVELIAQTEQIVSPDSIPVSANKKISGIEADNATHLEVLQNACKQVDWEFEILEGVLYLKEKLGSDRTNEFILRNGTNMLIENLSDGDGELCNILTAYGEGDGLNRLMITIKDEESVKQYGPYPKTAQFDANTLAQLQTKAGEFLEKHKYPATDFRIKAVFDSSNEPDWHIGDFVKVADPSTGIIVTSRIMELAVSADSNNYNVSLYLGSPRAGLAQEALEGKEPPRIVPKPFSVIIKPGTPGLIVAISREATAIAEGSEVYASLAAGFAPGQDTLVARGKSFKWALTELTAGEKYYIRVRLYDSKNTYSLFSEEYAATAGYVKGAEVEDDSITAAKYKEVRNILPWTGECIIDENHSYEFAFEIPEDTIRIQQIKFSATGERFRSYSQSTESAEIGLITSLDGGGMTVSSIDAGEHTHKMDFATLSTSAASVVVSTSVSIQEAGANLGVTYSQHSHTVSGAASISTDQAGDPPHSHQGGGGIEGTTSDSWGGVRVEDYGHAHDASVSSITQEHDHDYTVPVGTTQNGGLHSHKVTTDNHMHGVQVPAHNHTMQSGIFESSTPESVFLYWDNGDGYYEANRVALAIAPDLASPYVLASGLDLTDKFSGKGYKRIKLVSSRQGRILFQILAKLDIIAR